MRARSLCGPESCSHPLGPGVHPWNHILKVTYPARRNVIWTWDHILIFILINILGAVIDICIMNINSISISIVSFTTFTPCISAVDVVLVHFHRVSASGAAPLLHQAPPGPDHVDAAYESEDYWDRSKAKENEESIGIWNLYKCFPVSLPSSLICTKWRAVRTRPRSRLEMTLKMMIYTRSRSRKQKVLQKKALYSGGHDVIPFLTVMWPSTIRILSPVPSSPM